DWQADASGGAFQDPVRDDDLRAVGRDGARQSAQERRLAAPVGADERQYPITPSQVDLEVEGTQGGADRGSPLAHSALRAASADARRKAARRTAPTPTSTRENVTASCTSDSSAE